MGILFSCLRVRDHEDESITRVSNLRSKAMTVLCWFIKYQILSQHLESEEEDDCPTCFEEYNEENPRIVLQCRHVFHLACIYEWMERSDACPFCSKKMVFLET